jgi:hypothetical protein
MAWVAMDMRGKFSAQAAISLRDHALTLSKTEGAAALLAQHSTLSGGMLMLGARALRQLRAGAPPAAPALRPGC